jgi:hypothetical protein
MLATERELVGARRRCDHLGSEQHAKLDRGDADATGGTEHEQRISALDRGAIDERVHRCRVRQQRRCADLETNRVGKLHDA